MSIASAIVLYLVLWFLVFLIALPVRIQTQGDVGQVLAGTSAGSPEHHHLGKKLWIATLVAALIWAVVAGIIVSGAITVRDIDMFGRMGPESPLAQ
jgi:predicted secreted protein